MIAALPAELVMRARLGEPAALERLLAEARPDLERYARRHCASDDVDEAIQDALWILYRKVGGLRSAAALTGWLVQVVRRACLRLARRRPRHAALEDLAPGEDRDRVATDAELRAILAQVIARLPDRYREVIVLKDVQGLSAEELAATLGIGVDAAKSRLHRARAMVREALAGNRGRPA